MGTPTIRAMADDEVESTVLVWTRSRWDALRWLEARMAYTPEDNLAYFRDTLMRDNEIFVAVDDEQVVGLLALGHDNVDQLFVEPDRQGRGIGSALLERAKALRPRGLRLFAHQRNERARAFYERRGFHAVAFGVSPAPESEPDVEYRWSGTTDGDSP
jgi:ribosomal protein S18 acetylase RimI-like enzyme